MKQLFRITIAFWLFVMGFGQNTNAQVNVDSLLQNIESGEPEVRSESYLHLVVHYRRNDSTLFKEYLQKGIAHAQSIDDQETELTLNFSHIKWLYSQRKYDECLENIQELLPRAQQENLPKIQAGLLNYEGSVYSDRSDYPKAVVSFLEYYTVAQGIEEKEPVTKAMASNNVGMALLNMERHNQAIDYLEQSLDYQNQFDSWIFPHTYWNLGICYMEKQEYDKALEIFQKGVESSQELGNKYTAAGNQLCIASIYLRQDEFEKGISAYKKAYEMGIEADSEPWKLVEALNGLIYAHNQLSQPSLAAIYVQKADSITEVHDISDLRNREFLFYKATNLYMLQKPEEADAILMRYNKVRDSLQSAKNLELIQEKETEFRTKEKEQQLELQSAELDFQRLMNGLLGGGAVLLLLIGYLVYRQQRLKMKQQRQERDLREALLTMENNRKLEEQRVRIAKELHDNIGSQLTYLASAASNIGQQVDESSTAEVKNRLAELSDFSQEAITDLRDTIWVMNRSLISWDDLHERVKYLAHKVSNLTGIQVDTLKTGDSEVFLDPAQALNIYRIVQEAVNNAIKHAEAEKIEVHIADGEKPTIEIRDDGKGFDHGTLTTGSHGIHNMTSRAEKIGGSLQVDSKESGGTVIQLNFPNGLRAA